ncbi:uncharacterized protein LOC131054877 isoform X2 [Cryptomeria japonica]|uniref:uncharacterized protein LOC131054877 isoform X2 n=1 Tax=Cryptomeria japonica TaxID=3369 RepID=UPI0027DA9AA0|nr:uncharacterized protein LOC131054877 isoform X2 [Cryptomeria japonica]
MAMEENTLYLYNALSPLLDCDSMYERSASPGLLLDEAADASPISKKKKTRKCVSDIKYEDFDVEEELRFLKKSNDVYSEPPPVQISTVFRREIVDPYCNIISQESSDGEVEYLSLEVQSPDQLKEDVSAAQPVTPVLASQDQNDKVMAFQDFIWTDAHRRIRSPVLLLHQEIMDLCHFLSPTPEEQAARIAAVERVSGVIKYIWPDCQVKVFGSFGTGLYLPSSDIDVVILDSDVQVPQNGLQALAKALLQKSLATKIQVIGKARVPIVKFIEKKSNVAFDVSFDVQNGPEAAEFIKVYSGGIGSYALLVMLITHLQVHWRQHSSTDRSMILEDNLGILLIDFFDLYGHKLNAWDVGVSCRSGGQFFPKRLRGFRNSKQPHLLSVEDPQAPENDIGKTSYNIYKVRAAFVMAHRQLTYISVDDLGSPQHSILGRIIQIDAKLLERKAGFMKVPKMDILLSIATELDSDGGRQDSVKEKQGNLSNKFDNEPLALGRELLQEVHGSPLP